MRGKPRSELGMPGAGPVKIITDMGILEANGESGEMELTALYPGVTADDMRNAVGWPLRVHDALAPVAAPTARELALLRDVLDPQRRYLKGGA
jgi:glutaconate CoA-transferase subunit B